MELIKLTKISEPLFDEAWDLYEFSFPAEERRTLSRQAEIMNLEAYNFEVILHENQFVGILLWWGFGDFRFIDHLAVAPHLRGKGFGKKIMEQFIKIDPRRIILEVEVPEDELKERRIRFYQNLGFKLNDHFYLQPPMREGCGAIELLLMSYPESITKEIADDFAEKYHPVIYAKNWTD